MFFVFIVNFVKLNVVTACKKPMTVVLPVVDISALIDFFSIAYAICTPSFYTIISKLKIIEFTDTRNLCCFADW